jgi:hypothetical protein
MKVFVMDALRIQGIPVVQFQYVIVFSLNINLQKVNTELVWFVQCIFEKNWTGVVPNETLKG